MFLEIKWCLVTKLWKTVFILKNKKNNLFDWVNKKDIIKTRDWIRIIEKKYKLETTTTQKCQDPHQIRK